MWTRKNNTWLFTKDNNIIGIKYNMLTIVEEIEWIWKSKSRPNWYRQVRCKCDCWKLTDIPYSRVKTWNTKSCWCLARTNASNRLKWNTIWLWRKHSKETKEKMKRPFNPYIELKDSIRDSISYKNWRKQIFERDNYTCQLTWEVSSWNIEAHHLEWLTTLIIKNNINTLYDALECDELWDINNWITLNRTIHNKFHCIYWFWDNTPEQFNEFKNTYGTYT